MRAALASILLAASGFVIDCGFDSIVPLGSPSASMFDARLVGAWSCRDDEDEGRDSGALEIIAFNESEYLISIEESGDHTQLRGFVAELDGRKFLNTNQISPRPESTFVIFGYAFDADGRVRFRIVEVGSGDDKPKTPAQLVALFRRALSSENLFDEGSVVCQKAIPASE
jgi:hypothetical protein